MSWLTPRTVNRRPGTPGVIVVLADVSGSISPKNKARIANEAAGILRSHPRARLFAFIKEAVDIRDPSRITLPLWDCYGDLDLNKDHSRNCCTYMGKALSVAAQLNPERTIVLSDGGTADKRHLFAVADAMTGNIDAYYCEPRREEYNLENYTMSADELYRRYTRDADPSVMQELARRGGGRFEPYPSAKGIYLDYGIRDAHPGYPGRHPMKRPMHINGPAVNIRAPQNEVHRVTRRIDVYHQDEIHHHHGEAEHIHHGEQQSIDIEMGQARVNVQRPEGYHIQDHRAPEPPRGFWGTLFKGPQKKPGPPTSTGGVPRIAASPASRAGASGSAARPSPAPRSSAGAGDPAGGMGFNEDEGALMWMQRRVMQRRPGREGVVVVLADVSGSIGAGEAHMIKQACEEIRHLHEGLRFFAWACEAIEVPWRKKLFGRAEYPDLYDGEYRDGRTIASLAGGGNDLPKVLGAIAPLNPCKTIILSDGMEANELECQKCLRTVDGMTGAVDAFCTSVSLVDPTTPKPAPSPGPAFMAELARRGGGRFIDVHRCDLRAEVKRSVHVVYETQVHHHRLPPKHIHHWS